MQQSGAESRTGMAAKTKLKPVIPRGIVPKSREGGRSTRITPLEAAENASSIVRTTEAPAEPVARASVAEPGELTEARIPRLNSDLTPPAEVRERPAYDGDTAIKLYLREIGQVKLLTPQEEIELAARIKRGDRKARESMIKANLRLVVKIAHDYEGLGLPLLDLINEGNIGLMKAV